MHHCQKCAGYIARIAELEKLISKTAFDLNMTRASIEGVLHPNSGFATPIGVDDDWGKNREQRRAERRTEP